MKASRHPLGHPLAKLLLIATLLLAPATAWAQGLYTYSVAVLGGIGGSPDASPGDSLTNQGFQLNLAMVTEPGTVAELRLGHLGLDTDHRFGSLTSASLDYVTIGGEYRNRKSYYDSGVFLGLGGYRLKGDSLLTGRSDDQSAIGIAVGVTGEFLINQHLGILIELSGHWANLDEQQTFAMAHAGLAFHF